MYQMSVSSCVLLGTDDDGAASAVKADSDGYEGVVDTFVQKIPRRDSGFMRARRPA